MKRAILTITLLALAICLWGQEIPQIKLANIQGKSVDMTSFINKDKPFVISFWSTTCKPCINELDVLSELYPDWIEECDFTMIAVSIDDSRSLARAKAMAQGRGWEDFTLLFDTNSNLKRALNVILTPQVFVFNKDGKQVYSHSGYKAGDEYELFEAIKKAK